MASPRALTLNKQLFNANLYKRVHALWFASLPPEATSAPPEALKRWFAAGTPLEKEAFDSSCRSDFHRVLDSIGPSQYVLTPAKGLQAEKDEAEAIAAAFMETTQQDDQIDQPTAALSLVILLDQMPRNIYRSDQKVIYNHFDRLSRAVTRTIMAGQPRLDHHPKLRWSPVYRLWFYMPLMHSEYLEDHETLWAELQSCMEELASRGDQAAMDYVAKTSESEEKHYEIIKRFGRYPYRNPVLDRQPTQEEIEWLESGGESFGTTPKPKA